jgi:aminoglycoside 2''-phosphotransferase
VSTIRFLGGGSHRVFEISGFLIFKFPHGSDGNFLTSEKHVCDRLKLSFSLPIPDYRYFSEGIPEFPRPIAGYQKLPGVVLEAYPLERPEQKIIAPQVARFLTELNSVHLDSELVQILGPFSHESCRLKLREFYENVRDKALLILSQHDQDWTHDLFEEYLNDEANWQFKPVLIHGDFDSSNLLYHPCRGRIVGVIDFEEAAIGDPALDFCSLLAEFGHDFVEEVLRNYAAPIDDTFRNRVIFHSKRIVFHEILYGMEYDDDDFLKHGMERLQRAIQGDDIIGGWLAKSTSKTRYVPGFPL